MTSSVPACSTGSLTALVKRVANGDRQAFRQLYDALRDPTDDEIRGNLTETGDVRAVLHVVFAEVWWLARFHSTPGDDVTAWVLGVAARRTAERHRLPRSGADLDITDETGRLTFEGLLGEPLRTPRRDSSSG